MPPFMKKIERNFIVHDKVHIKRSKLKLVTAASTEFVQSTEAIAVETPKNPTPFQEILLCFSFIRNLNTFTKVNKDTGDINCIYGLRFFGMIWVIFVHSLYFQGDFVSNAPEVFRISERFASQIMSNSTYCVDTYLFLGGFLLGYVFFKNNGGKPATYPAKFLQFVLMCTNRYLRLTVPYAFVILFCDVIFSYYRETAALSFSEKSDMLCDKFWWRNVLYINNLFPRSEMCLSWSWYLSLDTQLFAISSFLLILSTMYFVTATTVTFGLILLHVVSVTYKSYSIGYIPTLDEQLHQLDAIYDLPWQRTGPYLIGVITAYFLAVKLDFKLVLAERTRRLLWTLFPLLNVWILFTIYGRNVSVEFSAFYMGISRTLWGIGIAWVTVACSTNNAGILDNFLSYKAFVPLARLTYCAYLLNPVVAVIVTQGGEAPLQTSAPQMILSAFGIVLLAFFFSFFGAVLIEFPFVSLAKILLSKLTNPKERQGK